ncbi:MAG: IPT/TIG domain-containing protein [Actinomycetota bacterium]|nr:IPT/TIG domain-containing protein [Actinomycetota bacterium]
MGGKALNAPIVSAVTTPSGAGYWEVASDGGVFSFGDAGFFGSMGGKPLNKPIVGMAATPDGAGYWEVASDGGVFSFGDAKFLGSTGGRPLSAPIVAMVAAPHGAGYWEVASDGGLFSFGDARYFGSMGGKRLDAPIVALATTPDGGGYWEVASDGGLFSFGDARYFGSMGGKSLNAPIVDMTATPDGAGYWEVASDGGVFSFGDASFSGSMGGKLLNAPITGMAVSGSTGALQPNSMSSASSTIAAGYDSYCAVVSSGRVGCWGLNNYQGVLGGAVSGSYADTAVPVVGVTNATSVVAGASSYCAVVNSGGVDCWGSNYAGQLGNGWAGGYSNGPVSVLGITNAVSVVSAHDYTYCAVLAKGGVDCWGDNSGGELGNGTMAQGSFSDVPVAVLGITNAVGVSSVDSSYCAVLATGGIDCWGQNSDGELGNGAASGYYDAPASVVGVANAVSVTPDSYAGYCAVFATGGIDCWGQNSDGELGNGAVYMFTDVPTAVVGISNAVSVASGWDSSCALLATGHVDCWGDNSEGQLGNGTTTKFEQNGVYYYYIDVPTAVKEITNAVSVVSGWDSTCATLATGHVDCWGDNRYGQLGNGTYPNPSSVPVEVSVITNVTALTDFCAALASGAIYCWGENSDGELGNGSIWLSSADVPTQVLGITGLVPPPAPTVTSISPTSGSSSGATPVTITGTNLASAAAVDFGANTASVTSDTATQIVVASPAGTAGAVNVSVTTAGGTVTDPNAFTYVTANHGPTTGPVVYDALGDSYSSGEGTGPPYLRAGQDGSVAASDTPSDQCHRSKWAYSVVLHTKLLPGSWVPTFAACSGATTNDLMKLGQHGERAQVKWLGNSPDLVTLTIGGNNVKFAPTLEYCIGLTFLANTYNRLTEPPWPLPRPPGLLKMNPSCADSPSFRTSVEHSITNARSDIEAAYALVRHTAGPNASVVAIGYPELFPTQFSGQNCVRLSPWLTPTDQTFFNQMAGRLDNVESLAAIEAGVNFVNVRSAFAGHGVCGSKGEWINGITWTNTDTAISIYIPVFVPGLPPRLISISVPIPNLSGSFHPDALGQLGYAKAIVDYMSQQASAGAPLNTDGFPLNPAPGVAAGTVAHASTNTPVRLPTPAAGSG